MQSSQVFGPEFGETVPKSRPNENVWWLSSHQSQAIVSLFLSKLFLFVTRLDAFLLGKQPNLIEMNGLITRRIELAVGDSCPG